MTSGMVNDYNDIRNRRIPFNDHYFINPKPNRERKVKK